MRFLVGPTRDPPLDLLQRPPKKYLQPPFPHNHHLLPSFVKLKDLTQSVIFDVNSTFSGLFLLQHCLSLEIS